MKTKLSKEKMKQIKGGMSAKCKQLQALANSAASQYWDNDIWDTWASIYERNNC